MVQVGARARVFYFDMSKSERDTFEHYFCCLHFAIYTKVFGGKRTTPSKVSQMIEDRVNWSWTISMVCHLLYSNWNCGNKFHIFFNVIFSWIFIFSFLFHCWCPSSVAHKSLCRLLYTVHCTGTWNVFELKCDGHRRNRMVFSSHFFFVSASRDVVIIPKLEEFGSDVNSSSLTAISLIKRTNHTLTTKIERKQYRAMAFEWTNFLWIQFQDDFFIYFVFFFGSKAQYTIKTEFFVV